MSSSYLLHSLLMRVAVPQRLRLLDLVRSRESWGTEAVRAYQEEKLRETIRYCWQYVPFYRRHWKGYLDDPRDIRTLEDLQKLPVVSRQLFRENVAEIITTDPAVKYTEARTGGSTASPIIYRTTHHDDEFAWAQLYSGWYWAGWRFGEPFLIVGGESVGVGIGDRRTRNDWIINRWVTSGSNITTARTQHLVDSPVFKRATFIYGYPNSIRELCERLSELGARPPRVRGVVCTAEVMLPEVRARISEVLGGVPVLDQWGLGDGAQHACESSVGDGLHVSFHRGILEVVDDQDRQIWDIKQTGRGLATSLTNLATPFVRYETGDQIHWHSFDVATSGVRWPRIGTIEGRIGDVIHLPSGRSIPMPGLTLVMRWLEGLKHFQLIQTGPNAVTVRLDRDVGYKLSDEETLAFLRQRIAPDVDWNIVWDAPELTRNGKLLVIRNDWLRKQGLTRPPPSPKG
jgi:phenylacetate-CoA ligase